MEIQFRITSSQPLARRLKKGWRIVSAQAEVKVFLSLNLFEVGNLTLPDVWWLLPWPSAAIPAVGSTVNTKAIVTSAVKDHIILYDSETDVVTVFVELDNYDLTVDRRDINGRLSWLNNFAKEGWCDRSFTPLADILKERNLLSDNDLFATHKITLQSHIDWLGLSTRAGNCLVRRLGHKATVGDVTQLTEQDLLKIHYLGPRILEEIKSALAKHGFSLRSD